ncbi:unnamed protein product, partial [Durusdinium trenchii]
EEQEKTTHVRYASKETPAVDEYRRARAGLETKLDEALEAERNKPPTRGKSLEYEKKLKLEIDHLKK